MSDDLVYRLRKRAEIRRQIPDRKSVQEGQPDRIADLLEEAADALENRESVEQPDLAKVGEVGVWGDKREWVGLHEHELQVLEYNDPSGERLKLAKAVEAKLKEKNHG
jgi:signal recognition particle subunit SEC65